MGLNDHQICDLLLELQKPPAPVALQGRLCLSGKPHELNLSSLYVGDDSVAKTTTKKHFLVLMLRNIGKFRGRGSFKIWPR